MTIEEAQDSLSMGRIRETTPMVLSVVKATFPYFGTMCLVVL